MRHPAVHALLAFGLWGLMPLYIRQLAGVPAMEVLLQRSAWALVFLLAVLAALGRLAWLREVARQPRLLARFAVSALLLSVNWLVYIVAVQEGHVVEASLGYFINPLFSVVLGVLVLKERLTTPQWVAVALAAAGVAWLGWLVGRPPWIALTLAASFGLYGLMRKTAALGALEGLTLETLLMAPLVLPALAWWTWQHGGVFTQGNPVLLGWLLLAGPMTALPLLFFGAAARGMPLATLGMFQYLSPTLQLLLGVFAFGEPFDPQRLIGFALIWSALALVSADALRRAGGAPPAS
ncbi:Transporter [Rubrivivax sp. A210]|uniref:EamA family transporter RarD n=1 Tax=Rubrivivax sp. A210 TaxID=2772301 RepID=UPI00191B5DA5|nr:EamA family transporter RarD [Rubrivivax sp. A210]CAD5371661.1 Transporter [Rubrivivax sp. A210]